MMVLFFTHIPFVVNRTLNATPPERLQQHPLLFTTNHTDRTFFVWRLNSVRPSHLGHSTILLQSEILSGMRAKLRIVAASNNRDHANLTTLTPKGNTYTEPGKKQRNKKKVSRARVELLTIGIATITPNHYTASRTWWPFCLHCLMPRDRMFDWRHNSSS